MLTIIAALNASKAELCVEALVFSEELFHTTPTSFVVLFLAKDQIELTLFKINDLKVKEQTDCENE